MLVGMADNVIGFTFKEFLENFIKEHAINSFEEFKKQYEIYNFNEQPIINILEAVKGIREIATTIKFDYSVQSKYVTKELNDMIEIIDEVLRFLNKIINNDKDLDFNHNSVCA